MGKTPPRERTLATIPPEQAGCSHAPFPAGNGIAAAAAPRGSGSDPPRQVLSAAGPWAPREAKAAGLLQVGAALLLAHLPQVQRVVVQQREEPALGMEG